MDELLKTNARFSAHDIVQDATEALSALSTLLGRSDYFFGNQRPGLFDASVFAYTHLLLDEDLKWQKNELGEALTDVTNLVEHRHRIFKLYFKDH